MNKVILKIPLSQKRVKIALRDNINLLIELSLFMVSFSGLRACRHDNVRTWHQKIYEYITIRNIE